MSTATDVLTPPKPKSKNFSFRPSEAVLEKGNNEVPGFSANFSNYTRAAINNFIASGCNPKPAKQINRLLETKAGDQKLVRLTVDERSRFRKFARLHRTTPASLANSALCHALGVLQIFNL
jgi:hypothetical protein